MQSKMDSYSGENLTEMQKMEQSILRNAGFIRSSENVAQISTKIFYETTVRHLKERMMNLEKNVAKTDALLRDDRQKYQTLRSSKVSKVGIIDETPETS